MSHVYMCKHCWEKPVENRDTGLCASCGRAQRKADQTQVKEKKPINKVSANRAVENKEYARLRRDYLEAYPCCEVSGCDRKSQAIHHRAGRSNDMLNDTNFWMAVCNLCHERIHAEPNWSLENGYIVKRSV